jgi:hypothetical protein
MGALATILAIAALLAPGFLLGIAFLWVQRDRLGR